MNRTIWILTAVILSGSAAQGADLMGAPLVKDDAPSYDWSGLYGGVVAGYGTGTVNYPPVGAIAGQTVSVGGGLAGLSAGHNAQWDMFVLGIEGDVAVANPAGTTNAVGFSITSTVNWIGTIRARAGVAVDSVFLYTTAGLAAGAVTTQLAGFAGVTPYTTNHFGWTVGAGAEVSVTESVSLKAEYAYNVFNSQNIPANALFPGATASTVDANFHTVKLGANFHF